VTRLETVLFGLFLACWVVDLLVFFRIVTVAGSLALSFYPLYSAAMSLGWFSGYLYERRRGDFPEPLRRRVFLLYFVGPPGLIYLLRAMAPLEAQYAAPLVTLYACGVFSIFFWVPIKFPIRRDWK
jgi:hypothetical protein